MSRRPAPFNARRRTVLAGLAATATSAAGAASRRTTPAPDDLAPKLAALEQLTGGRLGVCVVDPLTGRLAGWRADERFAMCSTFKLPLAALVLRDADAGRLDLAEFVAYTERDLVPHSPVTQQFLRRGGMTVQALAESTQKTSDNPAANLLLRRLGGPTGFTARLRELGDATSRLDRYEPELNLVNDDDPRDTTTPRAMATLLGRVLGPGLLQPDSRAVLLDWMRDTHTGLARLRAGLPAGWDAGDKTGTAQHESMRNKHNDVAFLRPPGRTVEAGIAIVASYHESPRYFERLRAIDDAVHADVGRLVADWIVRG